MKITRWIVEMERKVFSVVLSSVENDENRQKQKTTFMSMSVGLKNMIKMRESSSGSCCFASQSKHEVGMRRSSSKCEFMGAKTERFYFWSSYTCRFSWPARQVTSALINYQFLGIYYSRIYWHLRPSHLKSLREDGTILQWIVIIFFWDEDLFFSSEIIVKFLLKCISHLFFCAVGVHLNFYFQE